MDPFQARPSSAPTLCTGLYYSWPCGHTEDLGNTECMFADEPNLQNHVHVRQNLGNPGYACPVCPQEELPAPTYYPPIAEHPSFDRIAALQWQLDAFVHNQVREGRLPESSLPQAEWGYVAPVVAPYWQPSQAETRARLDRAAAILENWPVTRQETPLQQPDASLTETFRGEFTPGSAWEIEAFRQREALRQRTQWVRRTQIRQEQRAAHALQNRLSRGLPRGLRFAPPIHVNRSWRTQATRSPLDSLGQVEARADPGLRRSLELVDEMNTMDLGERSRQ